MTPSPTEVVERYLRAMAAGQPAQDQLLALFTDDAVYVEPFAGPTRTHAGLAAIRAAVEASWATAPPDLRLHVDRIDAEGAEVRAAWTCTSPVFPAPVRGEDRYTIRAGLIARLEVRIMGTPPG